MGICNNDVHIQRKKKSQAILLKTVAKLKECIKISLWEWELNESLMPISHPLNLLQLIKNTYTGFKNTLATSADDLK